MKKLLNAAVAVVAVVMTFGTASIAAASTPVAVSATPMAAPQVTTSSGCEGGMRTVAPNRTAIAQHGAAALFTSADLAADPTLPSQVPAAFKKILAENPTWVQKMQCGAQVSHDGDQVVSPTRAATALKASPAIESSTNAYSTNWSGYVRNGVDFDHKYYESVSGTWSVPSPPAPTHGVNQLSVSQWVGIGPGSTTGTGKSAITDQLLQAGTVSYSGPGALGIGPSGTYGFYEIYPYQQEQMISNYHVNGGDAASSYVIYSATQNALYWGLCTTSEKNCVSGIEDMTGNVYAMAQQGEWILERHGFAGGTSMLEPFGTITSSYNQFALENGPGTSWTTYNLGGGSTQNTTLQKITMTQCSGGTPYLDSVSGLGSTGNFTTTFKDTGTTC